MSQQSFRAKRCGGPVQSLWGGTEIDQIALDEPGIELAFAKSLSPTQRCQEACIAARADQNGLLEGARQTLMKDERIYFLETEWPKIYATIARLGLTTEELMKRGAKSAPASQPFPTRADAGSDDDSDN